MTPAEDDVTPRAPALRLGRQAAAALLISVLGQAGLLIVSVVVTRALGPAGKGDYSLFSVTCGAIALVGGLGIGSALMFSVARDARLLPHMRATGCVLQGSLGAVAALGYLGVALAMQSDLVTRFSFSVLVVLVLLSPLSGVATAQRQYLLSIGRLAAAKTQGAALTAGPLPGFVVLSLAGTASLLAFVTVLLLTQLAVVLLTSWLLRAQPRARFSRRLARRAASFGWRQFLADITQFFVSRGDAFLVASLLGSAALGSYSVAVALAEVASRLPYELATMLFPALAARGLGPGRVPELMRKVLLLSIVGALALAAGSSYLVPTLFGPDFTNAVNPLRVLLLGSVAWSALALLSNQVSASGHPLRSAAAFAAAAVTDAVLNLGFLPRYGILAAAWAAVASYTLAVCLLLPQFIASEQCRYRDVLLIRRGDIAQVARLLLDFVRPGSAA